MATREKFSQTQSLGKLLLETGSAPIVIIGSKPKPLGTNLVATTPHEQLLAPHKNCNYLGKALTLVRLELEQEARLREDPKTVNDDEMKNALIKQWDDIKKNQYI